MSDEAPRRPPPDLGPVTLGELNERLLVVEEVATIERDLGEATRFILGNLLLRLTQMGVIDGEAFILGLLPGTARLDRPTQTAARVLLADFARVLSPDGGGHVQSEGGSPTAPPGTPDR